MKMTAGMKIGACILVLVVTFMLACGDISFPESKPKFHQNQKVSVTTGFNTGRSGIIIDTRYNYTPRPHREYLIKSSFFDREWVRESELEAISTEQPDA